ncbi:P-loop containing nucleoside triphosphate hydrolase protein [Gigaspora rosea]|uniref:P-loop containing nucleoside triphosphate hydrolase protein n=1 Tax=Gigaspora rosea TaxID=44941 RepID=A0A397VAZ7_9GLOM|nr:P-loop containing nucleoside triphosphate hydrolase protein [Gigaspora rosea]
MHTRATVLLRRAQEFFPRSFLPPQTKLHTWPSLIHDGCVPQARHTHTYSDTKDALKTGVRNVKESIKEGVKTDLSAWKIAKWIGTGIVTSTGLVLFDLSFANWYNRRNERIILHAFEHGSCPEPDVIQKQLIYREVVIKKLRRILEPISDHSSYHVVVGNHGTGKTTVVRQCARDVGKGVIYVDVPPVLDNFIDNLAKAIGYSFKEYVSFTESFERKILGNSESAEQPRFFRVLDAFERGASKYKANNSKPPVLILDNISKLDQENVNMLKDLQDIAKLYADQSSCIIVFVSSEGTAPLMMMQRSSWSRAEKDPIVIEDLTSEEAFTYLHSKLGIEKKVTNQLIQLLGGRIRDLKEYGNRINRGETFEKVRKIVIRAVNHNFHQAEMLEGERNHVIGKVIVQELVKNGKIDFDTFIKLVNNKQIANELLQANVFSYNPESGTVTFQSHATEVFVRERPEFSLKGFS